MSIGGQLPLDLIENEDFSINLGPYYPSGYVTTSAFNGAMDFTGWSAQQMFRQNMDDVAPVLTLTPTFITDSTTGTYLSVLVVSLTAAQVNGLVTSLPSLSGYHDILLTGPAAQKLHYTIQSPVTLIRSVTR